VIAIIDYDIGNITSVMNMLQRLGLSCRVTASPDVIEQAQRIILPGNGAFDACMYNLRKSGLVPILERRVLKCGIPILGICVGAQMLGNSSDEGHERGLGWIDMSVKRFPALPGLRVPQMGWNRVYPGQSDCALLQDMDPEARFYFVHSYFMIPQNPVDVLLRSNYGIDFAAGIVRNNIAGVQFHPEKSHRFGKKLLENFAKWIP
jgi:glutamine amidotransferase